MNDSTTPDFRLRGARGAILSLLRGGDYTVADIAREVGLTRNGVRLHLGRLAAEGLVEQVGLARGVSKSSRLYGLSAAGRRIYSRAYSALLSGLVGELESSGDATNLLGTVARRLGPPPDASPTAGREERLERTLGLLRGLGSQPRLVRDDAGEAITIAQCPLADLSATHPIVCEFGRALVSAWTGEAIATRCTRGDRPHCRFEVLPPGA